MVRRGLAGRIADADPLTSNLPARARFPVRVTLSTGDSAAVDLRLFGPGDVIGVDPRTIIRTEPVRFARNFQPDQFAAIEFDPPDFPWMFTPAAPGASDRLRPWLVLVVVERQDGVDIKVAPNRPLPQIVIEAPAVPADELPDLSESWAWAHAHVVEAAAPASVADHLRDNPNLNVSRILCPRRLKSDRDYIAGLVPAFEVGRLAGLGQEIPTGTTTAPAWGAGGGVAATVTLPLYFHWEFRTGPAGDFESLARRLTPRPVPDTVGFRRMYIGAAHPALPPLAPDAGGIVELEGALRAPDAGTGETLGPEHQPWVDALVEVLNAPAEHVVTGASPDAETVSPPIYGGWPVKVSELGAAVPRWLGELNGDPRHRAAAGLGTEVVRINQERFMHAAWTQVGDVLRANALLDRARFIQEVADRIHRRHVAVLGEEALLALTAPVHQRVVTADRPLTRMVARSTLPAGVLDASFRRMASPRSPTLTRAARVAGVGGRATAAVAVVAELARGERAFDVLSRPPDGLVSSRLLDRFAAQPTGAVGSELGTVGTVPAELVTQVRGTATTLVAQPPPAQVVLRSDLAISGIVLPRHVEVIGQIGGGVFSSTIGTVLSGSLRTPGAVGFAVTRDDDGAVEVEVLERDERGVIVTRVPGAGGPVVTGPVVTGPVVTGPGGGGVLTPGEIGGVLGPRTGGILEPPIREQAVITRFTDAFASHQQALTVQVTSIIPAPAILDLTSTRNTLVGAIDPKGVIELRARLAVKVGGQSLAGGLLGPHIRQREPLDPVMVGPLLPEPLYQSLAKADPDRFLPGIGEIPDDTVTMVETNPRFVEAFLIGANHEMNRELLWRRYPTDRRGTPFHRFWDRIDGKEDLRPIHEFDGTLALGANSGADLRGSLVLLVRGQLLRRYPNAVVYAVPARADGSIDPAPGAVKDPVFWGRIDPDVTFVGFDLTRETVEVTPGWYFVIAEQPTEPRFGLDAPPDGAAGSLGSWSDLHWGHVGIDPGGYLGITASGLNGQDKAIIAGRPGTARFGRNAADMAAITFQRPFRAAIHSSQVIEGASPAGGVVIRPVLAHAVLLRPLALGGGG